MTCPTATFVASRVMTRSTRRVASGPLTMYLNSGETSISAAPFRIARVLVLVMRLVGADGVVARPLAVVEALAQRRACVRGRPSRRAWRNIAELQIADCRLQIDDHRRLRPNLRIAICNCDLQSAIEFRRDVRLHRPRRRAQRPRVRGLHGAGGPEGARARAAARARRRGGHRGGLPRLQVLGVLVRRVAAAARRSSASSTCRGTAWRSCRSTARSRRCPAATISGA